jgi:hypothetical protein
MQRNIRRYIAALTAVAALGGGASLAIAQSSPTANDEPPVDQAAPGKLSVLTMGRPPADASKSNQVAARLAGLKGKIDATRTRVARDDSKHTVLVMAGDDTLCLFREETGGSGATGCTDTVRALDGHHPITGVDWTDNGFRLTSLLPDGTREVELITEDGVRRGLEVKNNVISIETSSQPAELTWIAPAGVADRMTFEDLDSN